MTTATHLRRVTTIARIIKLPWHKH